MNNRYNTMKLLLGGDVANHLSKQVDLKVRENGYRGRRMRAVELAVMRGQPHERINSLVEDMLIRRGKDPPRLLKFFYFTRGAGFRLFNGF